MQDSEAEQETDLYWPKKTKTHVQQGNQKGTKNLSSSNSRTHETQADEQAINQTLFAQQLLCRLVKFKIIQRRMKNDKSPRQRTNNTQRETI